MKKVFLSLVCAGLIMVSMTSCKKECECTVTTAGIENPVKLNAGKMSKKDCEETKTVGTVTEGSGVTLKCTSK